MSGFNEAYAAHLAGRLEEAERGYRAFLSHAPKNAEAWHLLGIVAQQSGRLEEAVELIDRAVQWGGPQVEFLTNLGIILDALGRHSEAASNLEHAAKLGPASAKISFSWGNALRSLSRLTEAEARYREAIILEPANASAYNNLGSTLQDLGRLDDAAGAYRQTLALDPRHARAHYNLGIVLKETGRSEDAVTSFRQALTLVPDFVEAHINLGALLHDQGQLDLAIAHARKATALNPADAAAFNNLGAALRDAGFFDEAMQCYQAALALQPTLAQARHNEGVALEFQGRSDEALESYKRAHALHGDFAEAEQNAALLMLMQGDFKAGWQAYESRWRYNTAERVWRNHPYPVWQGEHGDGAVLVWGEQGVGDEVLYAGMIPDLMRQGHAVVMETDARLVALFERSFPGLKAVAKKTPADPATERSDIRWHTSIAGLGRWLRPDVAHFPNRALYLVADAARCARYRQELEAIDGPGPIVGISWASRNLKIGQHKSLDLSRWAPLLQIPGVRFVDLQYGDTAAERAAVEKELNMSINHIAGLDLRTDLDGVAALAAACDLVISVSSVTAHLAAALGIPTWIMVPASAGNLWYWMRGSAHTPWYPSAVLFRQAKKGDWAEVMQRLKKSFLASHDSAKAVTAN